MTKNLQRRNFVKTTLLGSIGLGLSSSSASLYAKSNSIEPGKIGIIGLDTSHSIVFINALNDPEVGSLYSGFRVIAAYPWGSKDIKSSAERIPGYIEEAKKSGVEIVDSIEELLSKTDYIMLETKDGRLHFEQALKVLKSGKRMFIDKPMAASLTDTIAIFSAAKHYKVPVYSTSPLRYIGEAKEIREGKIGKVMGADTYSPCDIEKTHPDLFWYGIHGVEILFTVMGTGCKSVTCVHNDDTDLVVGSWKDNRVGSFRGIRSGKSAYGGIVFGEEGIASLGRYVGYKPVLHDIIEYFNTGAAPVDEAETIEIYAFMQAAEESKNSGGVSVKIEDVMKKSLKEVKELQY